MNLPYWLNTGWMLKCSAESWAFHRAARRVASAQAGVLSDILRRNAGSEFGLCHRFADIKDPRDFQKQVPLAVHEDFAPAIGRIAAGERNVLTAEPVTLLEPTSGTTGGEKLIPFTASLRRQFQRAVSAWIADLFWHHPAARAGRAYWSISPALGLPRRSSGGIPIGFDDDAAYLGTLERFALKHLLVAPPQESPGADLEAFRYRTLLSLLAADDLALISVWSPTFLTSLLEPLDKWLARLCGDLHRMRRRRAQELTAIFRAGTRAEQLRQVWPRLALISCWADAASAMALPRLQELFPSVALQPKGLLATEGVVSFPLGECSGAALALRSHFFEFQPASPDGGADLGCVLAHEVELGRHYRVVLTTGGGLYRYQLRDAVEIVGFVAQCPLLRFLGKTDRIVDLVGEKLAENHVRTVLERVFGRQRYAPAFALLVPVTGLPLRYRLYFQGQGSDHDLSLVELQADLQAGLEENPYYRQAVQLGQLRPVEVCELPHAGETGWSVYERRCRQRGQRLGNIKPAVLDGWTGWPDEMASAFPSNKTCIV